MNYVPREGEVPVPRAALIAGIGILIMAVAAPLAELGFVMITFFGELIFMLWLLARGWAIPASVGRD